jgi:2'-5' RNA ligase
MAIRTFICVDVPDADRERIRKAQAALRPFGARVGWANPDGVHLTLAFLGDLSEGDVQRVSDVVKRVAERTRPFSLRVQGTGGFPSLDRPRVLWAGVTGNLQPLSSLHRDLWSELVGLGFPGETKAFHPHLTIGRVKDPRDRSLASVVRALTTQDLAGEPFEVNEIIVMRSVLGAGGSRYIPLARCAFRAP